MPKGEKLHGLFTERIDVFKAMGSESRQKILGAIERGVDNPGRIALELGMPRSTVEKHLRVMMRAGVVEKVPVLDEEGHISVRYEINRVAYRLRDALKEP